MMFVFNVSTFIKLNQFGPQSAGRNSCLGFFNEIWEHIFLERQDASLPIRLIISHSLTHLFSFLLSVSLSCSYFDSGSDCSSSAAGSALFLLFSHHESIDSML